MQNYIKYVFSLSYSLSLLRTLMTIHVIRIVNRADVCDTPGSCFEKSNRVDCPMQTFNGLIKKRLARYKLPTDVNFRNDRTIYSRCRHYLINRELGRESSSSFCSKIYIDNTNNNQKENKSIQSVSYDAKVCEMLRDESFRLQASLTSSLDALKRD